MEKINWGRVVLGGALAGVVLIAMAAVSTLLFIGQPQLRAAAQALRPSTSGIGAPLFFIFVVLFLGLVMTWSYVAMQPRFGPGLKTAAIAGLSLWVTTVCLALAGFVVTSIVMAKPYPLPSGPLLPCAYLVVMIVSTAAGASVYKEQQG